MTDPLRERLARVAGRAPAPAESGRTTFRLPPRAADALAWLTAQLRSTQKDVLAGLPDVVDDLRGTTLWESLASLTSTDAPAPPAAAPADFASRSVSRPLAMTEEPAFLRRRLANAPDESAVEPGERSTYVIPRDALDRLTSQAETLGLPRDEVVARSLVALRASVELRQAGRPEVIRSLRQRAQDLERDAGEAAEEAVALPPHDPIRVNLERAYFHVADARRALDAEPDSPRDPR